MALAVVLAIGGCAVYVSDYYPADEEAIAAFLSAEYVGYEDDGENIIFEIAPYCGTDLLPRQKSRYLLVYGKRRL